jgi:hypothetical protein
VLRDLQSTFFSNQRIGNQKVCISYSDKNLSVEKNLLGSVGVTQQAEEQRSGIKVNLTPAARRVLDDLKEGTGIVKERAVQRILEWFATLPQPVRTAVLMPGGDPTTELVNHRLGEIAAGGAKASPRPVKETVAIIRTLLAQIEEQDAGKDAEIRRAGKQQKGK